jgi:hypothetical protein
MCSDSGTDQAEGASSCLREERGRDEGVCVARQGRDVPVVGAGDGECDDGWARTTDRQGTYRARTGPRRIHERPCENMSSVVDGPGRAGDRSWLGQA